MHMINNAFSQSYHIRGRPYVAYTLRVCLRVREQSWRCVLTKFAGAIRVCSSGLSRKQMKHGQRRSGSQMETEKQPIERRSVC